MSNVTFSSNLPPLPLYTLKPLPPLIAHIPDKVLLLLLPIAAYWIFSLFFHYIDTHDYLSQYRLHTPAEVLKRNRVSRRDVVRDVIIQQVVQTMTGFVISMTEPDDFQGAEMYDITVWAQRIRVAQRAIPRLLSAIGIDSVSLAQQLGSYPQVAVALSGGQYPSLWKDMSLSSSEEILMPAFAGWELSIAKALYWFLVPAVQFSLAIVVVDTWQYFLHRAMHMNQWLYRTFHSRHHRLYVPYAFGALYNHPFEGFLLDTLGAGIAYKIAGLSTRQAMWFFTCSTIKTIDDHCGYALPWDPLQRLTSNNAGYHDIHHQTWGIKTNFSQPFFTFWDRLLGTEWSGGDVSARYTRSRIAAKQQDDVIPKPEIDHLVTEQGAGNDRLTVQSPEILRFPENGQLIIPPGKSTQQATSSQNQVLEAGESGGPRVIADEISEEKEAQKMLRRKARKRAVSSTSQSGSLTTLKDRVYGSLHGRAGAIIGLESG